jgi:hypothetical protein
MSKIENIQVIDMCSINLPEDMNDTLSDFYEASNGTYGRYYPDAGWKYLDAAIKEELNKQLVALGADLNVRYVLLHFNW